MDAYVLEKNCDQRMDKLKRNDMVLYTTIEEMIQVSENTVISEIAISENRLRTELRSEIITSENRLRTELKSEITKIRFEVKTEIRESENRIRNEMGELRKDINILSNSVNSILELLQKK